MLTRLSAAPRHTQAQQPGIRKYPASHTSALIHTHRHTRFHTNTLSLSQTYTHTQSTISLTLSLSCTHTHIHKYTHFLLPHFLTQTLSQSHPHSRTGSQKRVVILLTSPVSVTTGRGGREGQKNGSVVRRASTHSHTLQTPPPQTVNDYPSSMAAQEKLPN